MVFEYDSTEAILEFLQNANITRFTSTTNGIYSIHQHVYITKEIWIPRFRWVVYGNVDITGQDILQASKMPLRVYGQMKIGARGIADFNFFTSIFGKFIIDIKEPFLIQMFPNNCPEITFNGNLEMSDINMEKIYEYEKSNNSTIYLEDGNHDQYMSWLKGKERQDTIREIINS